MTGVHQLVAGRYRLTDSLGAGGLGRVWLAVDEVLQRYVAIKKCSVPDGLTEDEQRLVRHWTIQEARAVARVRHPNVVRIHDVLAGDGPPWIVMEYVPSRSLQQLIKDEGALPAEQAARIGLAVLHALNAAHRVGVLHLDVKPSNVLIADDGRVMLTDFGPAVTDAGIGALNRAGVILGSPAYVAPERLVDGASTAQADLWSLGATLYHATEGQPPYARGTMTATLRALGGGDLPDPPRLAGPLIPVLDGLLQRDPAARTVPAEVENRLRRLADSHFTPVAGLPHPAGWDHQRTAPPEPAGKTGPVPQQTRRRVAGLAALCAVLAVLAVVAAADRLPWPDRSARAPTQAAAPGPPTSRGPFVLPPHFSWWSDRSGFGVAVPSDWPSSRDPRNAVIFTAPGGQASLRVSNWTPGDKNVVTVLIGQERDATLSGYRRIRIEALPAPPDAVWEYTFRDPEAGPVRALRRIVARGGHTYLVEWHAPSKAWAGELPKLDVVLTSLRSL